MADDLNKCIFIGRLTRDPEIKYTPAGTAVASVSIANSKTFTTGGEKKEQVSYLDCIAWSKLGEIMAEYCKKGQRLAVECRAQQSRWNDQDGKARSKVEFVVESFQFLDGKDSGSSKPKEESNSKKVADNFENPFDGDDLPF